MPDRRSFRHRCGGGPWAWFQGCRRWSWASVIRQIVEQVRFLCRYQIFDKGDFFYREAVVRIEFRIGPNLAQRRDRHEAVFIAGGVLGRLSRRNEEIGRTGLKDFQRSAWLPAP